jgi:lysophospholipase L1-like esterase
MNGGSSTFGGSANAGAAGGGAAGGAGAKSSGGATNGGASNGGASSGGRSANGGAGSGTAGMGGAGTGGAGTAGAGGAGTPAACTTNRVSTCTGTNPITCHFGGNPGDYEVTLDLGGAIAGVFYLEAESFRRMLGQTTTAAGQTKRFVFFTNVRQPEGQPIQAVPAGTPGLDIYIRGNAPALSAICFQVKKPAPKLWIAGDSTVCDQDTIDYAGWGQHLPQFITPPVSVANYADSGESSGSFLGSGSLWGAIKSGWTSGDWVMIQFGHNDKDVTAAAFQSNLTAMVTQAKAAGVHPILITPISRVGYTLAEEHINSTGANLPQIVRDLAKSQNVPLIDLTVTTWNWIQTIDWTQYFALGTDHTHTNPKGAGVIAGFVRDAVRTQQLPLAPYLR